MVIMSFVCMNFEDGTFQDDLAHQDRNEALPAPLAPTATAGKRQFWYTPFLVAASYAYRSAASHPDRFPRTLFRSSRTDLHGLGRSALVILGLFALAGLILRVRR
jgi:hypothetical protein